MYVVAVTRPISEFWLRLIWPGISLVIAFPLSALFPFLFVQRYQAAQASSLEGLVAETFWARMVRLPAIQATMTH